MVKVSKKELEIVHRRFSNVYSTATRHHIFCEERPDILSFLHVYRKNH